MTDGAKTPTNSGPGAIYNFKPYKMQLVNYTHKADNFFNILPKDWQETIVPHWNHYKDSSRIYILRDADEICGGGIVFDGLSPDMKVHEKVVQKYILQNFKYLGFIWIKENHRSKGLGKLWLQEVFKTYPGQGFWLSIEDESLKGFYQKLGFSLSETLSYNGYQEWLMQKDFTDIL